MLGHVLHLESEGSMHSLLLFLSPNHSVAVRSHPCCFISPPVIYPWFDLMHLFETFIEALCSFLHIWRVIQFCYHCLAMRCSRNHVCNLLPLFPLPIRPPLSLLAWKPFNRYYFHILGLSMALRLSSDGSLAHQILVRAAISL